MSATAISTAIGSERVSRVSGYKILKGIFNVNSPNLPQQIVVLAEANTANQGSISTDALEITSAAQAAQVYGYGSPIHQIMRILRPVSGNGVGGIPTLVMAQLAAEGSTPTVDVWAISGVATANTTHYININGRETLDFTPYSVAVAIGDTGDIIATKYYNAVNAVLGSPVIATKTAVAGTGATSSVAFNATSLTAGQTVTLGGLTYTSTATTTQAQLAAAFASLANGATTGAGTGTGTYTGTLTGFSTGAVISNAVIFTAAVIGPSPANYPVVQSGTGAAATITNTNGTNPTGTLTLTTKWTGATSANLNTTIDINGGAVGVIYAQTSETAGAGDPDLTDALAQFGENAWYTTVINSYGAQVFDTLEALNGVPDPLNPTGLYDPTTFMPFMALFGNTDAAMADLIAITNAEARINQVTNVLCPAPNSAGFPWEAAANMVALFCPIMQNTPYLDANPQSYPDMPPPPNGLIGDMASYNNRDNLVKNGCSTVAFVNNAYQVQDLVTTYHPAGEVPLQFSYCRNLNLDWNVKDGYSILEAATVKDHVIIADGQSTSITNAIKPSEWKATLFAYFDLLGQNGLINSPDFSKKGDPTNNIPGLQVQIDPTNPNRFNTAFAYKRTGVARIESTDATAGF